MAKHFFGDLPDPDAAALIDRMLPQLLIALVKRSKGRTVTIPAKEIDDTGGDLLTVRHDKRGNLIFKAIKKTGRG